MRNEADAEAIRRLMEAIGREARGTGTVYLVGGATAVLHGWRSQTIDVDLKLDPEPAGIFGALRRLKDELAINIELAAPDQFLPPLPGWQERSPHIGTFGRVRFCHYDFYSQALAKIERGHSQDAIDVHHMLSDALVEPGELRRLFAVIEPELERYPAVDADELRRKLDAALPRAVAE
ncbi:MAG: DUF6036 family nucleotidyltransferase [Candidatus Latescibacterota bacterium]